MDDLAKWQEEKSITEIIIKARPVYVNKAHDDDDLNFIKIAPFL
jgi:hypothetical protein